jgi:hypothetical protein
VEATLEEPRRVLAGPRAVRVALLGYGAAAAVATVLLLWPVTFSIMPTREVDMVGAAKVLNEGGPPLTVCSVPWSAPDRQASDCRAAGATDDQGMYLYLSELAHWSGTTDPHVPMRALYVALYGLLVLLYPLLFYELFGSLVIALLAPVAGIGMLAAGTGRANLLKGEDLYWVSRWLMLLGLPALALARRFWHTRRRTAIALLVGLMVVASFGTSVRIHSGLPLLLSGLGIVAFSSGPRRTRALVAVAMTLAYVSVAPVGLDLVRSHRDAVVGQGFDSGTSTQHPFWHSAYIGLGYLPNRYGIVYNDTSGIREVESLRPGTAYLSPEYERTLRHRYLELLRHDPGFVLRNLWVKLRVILADTTDRYWLALIALPVALLFGPRRRDVRLDVALAVPALALMLVGPALTVPETQYESGWFGVWGYLSLLAIAWVVRLALRSASGATGARLSRLPQRLLGSRLLLPVGMTAAAACVVTAVGMAQQPAEPANPDAYYLNSGTESALVAAHELAGDHVVDRWRLRDALPTGWSAASGVDVEAQGDAVAVTTTNDESAAQLRSPTISLPAGSYRVAVDGSVARGGLTIAAVDTGGGSHGEAHYWQGSGVFGTNRMVLDFDLSTAADIELQIANWSNTPRISSWVLRELVLLRRG